MDRLTIYTDYWLRQELKKVCYNSFLVQSCQGLELTIFIFLSQIFKLDSLLLSFVLRRTEPLNTLSCSSLIFCFLLIEGLLV